MIGYICYGPSRSLPIGIRVQHRRWVYPSETRFGPNTDIAKVIFKIGDILARDVTDNTVLVSHLTVVELV